MELQESRKSEPRLSENDTSFPKTPENRSVAAPKAQPNPEGRVDVPSSQPSDKENPSHHPSVSARRRPSEPFKGEFLPFFFLDADDAHETHGMPQTMSVSVWMACITT